MSREVEVLQQSISFLQQEVKPVAELIDKDSGALRKVVSRMGELDLLALKRPEKYGGPGMNELLFRTYQEEVARVSGTLAFLTTQHQSAVSMIANGENEELKADYLPKMGNGERLVGIGFSQLRRSGPPIMTVTPDGEGYRLNGHVPWVTGWSFYPEFLIGATLPSGEALFAIVPFADIEDGSIRNSAPMQLASMGTALTVTTDFKDYFVAKDKVAFIKPAGWIQNSDMINIALQGHFAIGCAMAGIDVVRDNASKKPFQFLQDAVKALESELNELKMATAQAQRSSDESTTPERLEVRAWAIDFAVRCAHCAIAASSGAANSVHHPAQRIYREALVFSVSAQTPPIMEATLKRLTSRRRTGV
jgi:alkylation response protein AidB-like acyl-CoA dehydrogenase